ncbi:hypothetical protein BLA60_25245 [Actinophytocola xinjiangensis]|uniref:DUF4178 domain-containing protein n=1 Tax=Actinophytocola xinjiangensis TaxID=485602 RepID=A0A7Z0WJ43_9PSEU|nr:DUF4178 domain-containing protein [Actinophytocola xinjiangensis]OLF08164.1 hypothetical protein BLA60_25245 [Actinophytocola xinjiangensis]
MPELLLVLILLAVVVVGVLVWQRSRADRKPVAAETPGKPVDPLADHQGVTDIRTVRAGDMIEYADKLYFVRGSLRLTESGYSWSEHFLDDARGDRVWVSVEEDPDLEVYFWHETDLVDAPGGKTMEVGGVTYTKEEDGTARYTSEGTTTVAERGSVDYVDYEGPGGKALSFERFDGGRWEAGLGEEIPLPALRVYPAGSDRT